MEICATDVIEVDEAYEFCAPQFFDFLNDDTEEEDRNAEVWFETSLSYAPSPFMPKIKVGRSVQIESLCDFGNVDQAQKVESPSEFSNGRNDPVAAMEKFEHFIAAEVNEDPQEVEKGKSSFEFKSLMVIEIKPCSYVACTQTEISSLVDISTSAVPIDIHAEGFVFPVLHPVTEACTPNVRMVSVKVEAPSAVEKQITSEACTPKAEKVFSAKGAPVSTSKNRTAKKTGGMTKSQAPAIRSGVGTKPNSGCPGSSSAKSSTMTTDIGQENQAIKRQKLDRGEARQILHVKSKVLRHKSELSLSGGRDLFAAADKVNQQAAAFISTAEMVKKFQLRTRDRELSWNGSLSHDDTAPLKQSRTKLTLTRPKEPELETAHRVRAVRVKSSAEIEEEILAKIPKFKARPLNKKILEAPLIPPLPRSAPQTPEFQEFNFKTMERAASQHSEALSVSSKQDSSSQLNQGKPLVLTEPHPPHLETALRARPQRIKSSQELELEELEKIPKFKARPINKKILDSKGDLGLFSIPKPQVTNPKEFHFATDERLGPPATVSEFFDKLSLNPEPHHKEVLRITAPKPFYLHTENRGIEKAKQFQEQVLQKQLEEERARILKANPYPYTTDYPVMPPKPEPKQCTKPESFQLEGLIRHKEEMQRKLEEKQRIEKEEAERRKFIAKPIMKDDPLPLPERERKPLTEIQEFVHHVDHRAVHRSEFDKKIKEREIMQKRMREEYETAKKVEDEKAVKRMRRSMVPHARPLPKFDNPFIPQKSNEEMTKPISPELHVAQREERRQARFMR